MEDHTNKDVSQTFGKGSEAATQMAKKLGEQVAQAEEKITELGRKTVDKIDAQREPVAKALNETASAVHQTAENAAEVAHAGAEKLEAAADYVRQTDAQAMANDVENVARRYPWQALGLAATLGLLVGLLFRNRD